MTHNGIGWRYFMKKHAVIAGASAVLLLAIAGCGGPSQTVADRNPAVTTDPTNAEPTTPDVSTTGEAPAAAGSANPATVPAAAAERVRVIRGLAEVELTKPVTERVGNQIVTTMKVRNTSTTESIAGLKIDEFWYDKTGAPVTGDTFRHRQPLTPGEIVEVTLRTPVNPRMDRNQYQFAHANGDIRTTVVPKL
jgi:hypothetical protein